MCVLMCINVCVYVCVCTPAVIPLNEGPLQFIWGQGGNTLNKLSPHPLPPNLTNQIMCRNRQIKSATLELNQKKNFTPTSEA